MLNNDTQHRDIPKWALLVRSAQWGARAWALKVLTDPRPKDKSCFQCFAEELYSGCIYASSEVILSYTLKHCKFSKGEIDQELTTRLVEITNKFKVLFTK